MELKIFKLSGRLFVLCLAIVLLTVSVDAYGDQKNRPNIIILLLDCVRADHLGCYGYSRNTTPHIDALAAQGTKFNKAISQSPWTLPSVVSLLSGCYPHRHGAGLTRKEGRTLERDHKTLQMPGAHTSLLPELLRQDGYQTWGFSTNAYINYRNVGKRGFIEFKYQVNVPAEKVVDYGIKKIMIAKENRTPFFLYLHFMDAHEPLQPPVKYCNYFPVGDGKKNSIVHERWGFAHRKNQQGIEFESYKEHKISLYDGTIRYMDTEIGRLIEFLESSKLMASTIVVVVADHGEEFWEHTEFEATHYQNQGSRKVYGVGHGHTMFQELLWVPLIITNLHPKRKRMSLFKRRKKEVHDVVQLVDVFPTLLERIGFQSIPNSDGMNLLPLINRWRFPPFIHKIRSSSRSILSGSPAYGNLKISLIEFPYKCIYSYGETSALFNLEEDPRERENLFEERIEIASDMLKKIYLISNERRGQTEELSLSEEDLEALRNLGYIE